MSKPLLSIGIIFKNEIRCIERCLKSLQPLRDAVPCEVVMADTGSDDGSREIAAKYADILIDFPWINDFSAARNAVMDQCSGEWYLTVDCDEWLDEDIATLAMFVSTNTQNKYASVTVRNYKTPELERGGQFSDFMACRMLRMSTGIRFIGRIHERWNTSENLDIVVLKRTILHHDGYLYQDAEAAQKKTDRNMLLLREELKKDPDDLRLLMQCIESASSGAGDYSEYVYRAVQGVREKRTGWQMFGPSILRHAVMAATSKKLPELEEWITMAEEWFSNSLFTRIDVQYMAMGHSWEKGDYPDCIRRGELYFEGVRDFNSGNYDPIDTICSLIGLASPFWEQSAKLFVSAAYLMEKRPERCQELLRGLDASIMDMKQVKDTVRNLAHLHSRSLLDTGPVLTDFWEGLTAPEPSQEKADARKAEFIRLAWDVFHPVYRDAEAKEPDFCRHAYQAFLPLTGKCALGYAAQMLETEDSSWLEALLGGVDDLELLPPSVLTHALRCGARFPLSARPLSIEQMDRLISGIAKERGELTVLVERAASREIPRKTQELAWLRGLCMAAVKVCPWREIDVETGLLLARAFARVEKAYLPLCYAREMLTAENLLLLPPLHRFGFYWVQAFDALDAGDAAGYVRLLREGLVACGGVKDMVEFLIDHTPEIKDPSQELKALAEQIRAVLARFSPDDSAVAALKQSEAYQKVAYLIEGMEPPVAGGLMQ